MRIRTPTHAFTLGGQRAWFHDDGFEYGPVHTYDAFDLDGRPRTVHVLVPHDLQTNPARCPVVYLNDGQAVLYRGGPAHKSSLAAQGLGALRAAHRIPRLILVAVHPVDRDVEYTHAPWFPDRAYGGLPAYSDYLAKKLKPWIDAHYPTQSDGAVTAIVGASHGGLAAFHTACTHPDAFHLAGCLSPSFWVGRGRHGGDIRTTLRGSALMQLVDAALKNKETRPVLWIDWGLRGDGARFGAREMAELLASDYGYRDGDDAKFLEDANGAHDEHAWGWRLRLLLETFYGENGF